MSTFRDRVKALRAQKELTQEELASKLCVNRATLANWEIGRTLPDPETLQRVADFFNTTVDYLLGRTDDPRPPKREDKYAWMSKLSPHLRESLEKNIDKFAPYFRTVEMAMLNNLSPAALNRMVEMYLEARQIDEQAKQEEIGKYKE